MDSKSGIGKKALHYRVYTNEFVGLIIVACLSAVTFTILYFLKKPELIIIAIAFFILLFILQFIVLYLVSFMQFKNLKYNIGQNSISLERGSMSIETQTIPFEKIKNSTYEQSLIQRMFSVGDIIIDQDDEKFIWGNIDEATANLITQAIAAKSNIQPIAFTTQNPPLNPTANPS